MHCIVMVMQTTPTIIIMQFNIYVAGMSFGSVSISDGCLLHAYSLWLQQLLLEIQFSVCCFKIISNWMCPFRGFHIPLRTLFFKVQIYTRTYFRKGQAERSVGFMGYYWVQKLSVREFEWNDFMDFPSLYYFYIAAMDGFKWLEDIVDISFSVIF